MNPWRAVALIVAVVAVIVVGSLITAALVLYAMIKAGEAIGRAVSTNRQRRADSLPAGGAELDDGGLPPTAVVRHARCRRV